MTKNELRIAFGKAFGKYTKDVFNIDTDQKTKILLHKLGLKLIKYIFVELGISLQEMMTVIQKEDSND